MRKFNPHIVCQCREAVNARKSQRGPRAHGQAGFRKCEPDTVIPRWPGVYGRGDQLVPSHYIVPLHRETRGRLRLT